MFKLIHRRSVWLPSWQALLIASVALVLVAWCFIAKAHTFLSVTEPAEGARILVVEGWLSDDILERQFEGFVPGQPYDYVCTIGPTLDHGHYLSEYGNFADLAAATIEKLGVPAAQIITAPSAAQQRDRTYQAALGFKQKRDTSDLPALRDARQIDVLSSGAHARRTRTVFRKLLGDEVEIGIIARPNSSYDPDRWFASSQGVKTVIVELISLAYEWSGVAQR